MFFICICLALAAQSFQSHQDESESFQNQNSIEFENVGSFLYPGQSRTTENNGAHDPNISPYWADTGGRPPNVVPEVNFSIFKHPLDNCRGAISCNFSSTYRTMSGYCNNVFNPEYGMAGAPMPRILPARYDEGMMRIRSVAGGLLPNPRKISIGLRNVPPRERSHHNMMIMQLGQFIDHDYVVTEEIKGPGNFKKNCRLCSSWTDPACAPIPVPIEDPFILSHEFITGQPTCLPFTRSTAEVGTDILGKPTLDQVNANSAFLDLSTVYGSSECRESELRSYTSGQLIELKQHGEFLKGLLPLADAVAFEECRSKERKCFRAGDDRNNEHVGIIAIHMLYLREHNRIAGILQKINPHWNDEKLFQEARRINIAQYQNMIYSEFLPALIGIQKMTDYRLHPEKAGYFLGYNDRTNPGVLNEFSTSAFRVGHTMVPAHMHLLDKNFLPISSISLLESFHNISMAFLPGVCDAILRGFLGTRLSGVDMVIEDVLLDKLFERTGSSHSGEDLLARNIARGRDHGIAQYTTYKSACGGGSEETFEDLGKVMSQRAINTLQQIYSSVEDIDLFVGGLAEDPVPGGLVGPTFACIIAYQFLNSRRGDRFWFENPTAGFTTAQLHSIRGAASLSQLLCNNMDYTVEEICSKTEARNRIPRKPLFIPDHFDNPLWQCDRFPSVDLSLWTEVNLKEPIACTYQGLVYQWNKFVNVSPCLTCICKPDGFLKCEPNRAGCRLLNQDEFCKRTCDES